MKIGHGQFGDLYEGAWTSSGTDFEVAIEAVPSGKPDSKIKFLKTQPSWLNFIIPM